MPRKVIHIVKDKYHIIVFIIAIQRSWIFEICIIYSHNDTECLRNI